MKFKKNNLLIRLLIIGLINLFLSSLHFITSGLLFFLNTDNNKALRNSPQVRFGYPLYILQSFQQSSASQNGFSAFRNVLGTLKVDLYANLQFFNLVTAAFHFWYFIQSMRCYNKFKTNQIENAIKIYPLNFLNSGVNILRWIEYSITAPPMIIISYQLFGVFNQTQIFRAIILTVLTMFMGGVAPDIVGKYTKKDPGATSMSWDLFLYSSIAYMASWGPIIITFIFLWSKTKELPKFVIIIFFSQFFLFTSFAIVRFFHFYSKRKKSPKFYFWIEIAYLILSVTSKLSLTFLNEQNSKNRPFLSWI